MHTAFALGVALAVAAGCLTVAALLVRRRDGVLQAMTRLRGFRRYPPGPRRRYQRGPWAQLDMALPVVAFAVVGILFLLVGLFLVVGLATF